MTMSIETVHKRTCGSCKSTNSSNESIKNFLAEGSRKVAVDGFEPAIPLMTGRHASTSPEAKGGSLP